MPVTNVRSEWKDGNLVYRPEAGTNGQVIHPSQVKQVRARFTAAEINAGATLLAAIPGFKYRLVDVAMIAVGGAAATATSVDVKGTQAASVVKLMAGLVAGLTENTLLRAGTATNGVILAAGASFEACDVNTAITVASTTNDLATATHVDFLVTYVLDEA